MPRAALLTSGKFSFRFRSRWVWMGKETRTEFCIHFVLGKSHFLPMPHIPDQEGSRHKAGWAAGATYQRGLRLGVLPCSRGGRVVHEQIEGGVDGVFVYMPLAHSGVFRPGKTTAGQKRQPGRLGLKAVCSLERKSELPRGPLQVRDLKGWGCPQCQVSTKDPEFGPPFLGPHSALPPRNLGQRFLLKSGD